MYSPICVNICQWESCVQSGWRVWSPSQQRVDNLEHYFQLFQRNKKFLQKYVTIDETWIHHLTPESNRQSAARTVAGERRLKRPKRQTSAGKVLASIFWNAQGILFIYYVEKGRTTNSEYYIALLVPLKEEITKKWPQMKKKKRSFTKTINVIPWLESELTFFEAAVLHVFSYGHFYW